MDGKTVVILLVPLWYYRLNDRNGKKMVGRNARVQII